MQWLDDVADQIYAVYSNPNSNFNPTLHETYMDLGAFGTGVVFQEWDPDNQSIIFKSGILGECYFQENNNGFVDSIYQYKEWTGKELCQEFCRDTDTFEGTDLWKQATLPENAFKRYRLIRAIFPRKDRMYGKLDAGNKAYASYYVAESTMDVLRVSGYDSFPAAVTRWVKISGETYGRGPGSKCLPDITSLQTMEKTLLKAGQKAVDPPLIIPDEGFMEPISTAPGSIIYKETGAEEIKSLDFKGNLNFGVEQCNQKRIYIKQCFHEDWFKRFRKNREQSATEVLDDRDEMLRFLAPMLGRQQTELLGPLIKRTYMLLNEHGMIPPAPDILKKRKLEIIYISPAARAQQGVKADRMSRFIQDMIPLMQADPTVMDAVNKDNMVQIYATTRGVPRAILNSLKQIEAIRASRAQQQQAAQVAQTAEPASKSVLNLAQAQAATGGGSPGGPL